MFPDLRMLVTVERNVSMSIPWYSSLELIYLTKVNSKILMTAYVFESSMNDRLKP